MFRDKLPAELHREYEEVYTDCIIGSAMQNAIYFREGAKIGAMKTLNLSDLSSSSFYRMYNRINL